MKFENLKHGSLFKREFYLKDVKIDLKNDFFVYSVGGKIKFPFGKIKLP